MASTETNSYKAVVYTGTLDPLVKTIKINKTLEELIPGENQLLIKVHACSCNPTDFKHFLAQWGSKDITVGTDLAGTIVKVGNLDETNTAKFTVGDYVASFVHGGYTRQPTSGAFQEYVIVSAFTTLKFNHNLYDIQHSNVNINFRSSYTIDTFEAASSLPLGLATIGVSFQNGFKLDENNKEQNLQDWILIWGGTTATGFLAIQIAKKLYGLKVVTTANKANYGDTLKSIGADEVVDYSAEDAIQTIKNITSANNGSGVVYALDCFSSPETFNNTYACLRDGESYFDNLLSLQPNILTSSQDLTKNVHFSTTFVYLVHGDQDMNGMVIKSSTVLVDSFHHYWKNAQHLVDTNQIMHIPLTILPNGFESANAGLKLLAENKVSCHKIVLQA